VHDDDLPALAASDTVATLVPEQIIFSMKSYPNTRKLIDSAAAVALATDYNLNWPTISMSMAMSLACTQMKMPSEAIAAP
jgi:imidazolonepropionase